MPPKRRAASTRPSGAKQATLSFHGRNSKVSKPSGPSAGVKAGKDILESVAKPETQTVDVPSPDPEEVEAKEPFVDDDDTSIVAPPVTAVPKRLSKDDQIKEQDEQTAMAIPDTKIKAYWKSKENERKAPRVHQGGLSVNEKILREWDTTGRYGPNVGISRLRRWHRAKMLGLNPPIEVLGVLVRERANDEKKGSGNSESSYNRAYMDELLNAGSMVKT